MRGYIHQPPVKPGKVCERCGVADLSRAHTLTRFCAPCALLRDKDNGAYLARLAVTRAVKRGDLPRAKTLVCVDCGKPASDYDHRDYNKPLDVQPVCRSCNKLRGPAIYVVA